MKFLSSKMFIGLFCFLFGVAAVLTAQRFTAERQKSLDLAEGKLRFKKGSPMNMDPVFDQFYNDEFFSRSRDPFEQMRKMRNRLMKDFDEPTFGGGVFDSWYRNRFGGGDVGEIKRHEDEKFVYYDIGIKGIDKKNFNFKIADGQITISGQLERKSEENGAGTFFSSSFHRSFPVPPEVDGKKVQVEQNDDSVTLKFPKIVV